jgi:hypothetical protein
VRDNLRTRFEKWNAKGRPPRLNGTRRVGLVESGELRSFQLDGTYGALAPATSGTTSPRRTVALLNGWQPVAYRTEVLGRFRPLALAPA